MTLDEEGTDAAARLLAEAGSDPSLRADLARAYRGRHDVLDALRWRVHPDATGTGRSNDPAAELPELERRAYGRHASSADIDAFREAERRNAQDVAALDAAVAEVVSGRQAASDVRVASDGHVPSASTTENDGFSAEGGQPGASRSRRVLPVVAVLAVSGLVLTSGYLAYRLGESESRFAPAVPVGGLDPLARFAVGQTTADVVDLPLPGDYDPGTVRRLVRDQPGLLTDYSLFGARTEDQAVCMLMVFPDEEIASSCVSVPEFRRNGIRVSTSVLRPSTESEGAIAPVAHTVTWRPDDSLLFASSQAEGQ